MKEHIFGFIWGHRIQSWIRRLSVDGIQQGDMKVIKLTDFSLWKVWPLGWPESREVCFPSVIWRKAGSRVFAFHQDNKSKQTSELFKVQGAATSVALMALRQRSQDLFPCEHFFGTNVRRRKKIHWHHKTELECVVFCFFFTFWRSVRKRMVDRELY